MNFDKKNHTVYFLFALYTFVGLGIENLLLMCESSFFGGMDTQWSVTQICFHSIFTSIVWLLIAMLLIFFAKNKFDFDVFSFKDKITTKQWILNAIVVAIVIALSTISFGNFKPYVEYMSYYNNYKNDALMMFSCQYVYHIFEVLLILLIISFGQKAGELSFSKQNLPYGGFLLAIIWSLMHISSQSVWQVLYVFAISICFGLIYCLSNKNFKIAYILVVGAFLL